MPKEVIIPDEMPISNKKINMKGNFSWLSYSGNNNYSSEEINEKLTTFLTSNYSPELNNTYSSTISCIAYNSTIEEIRESIVNADIPGINNDNFDEYIALLPIDSDVLICIVYK